MNGGLTGFASFAVLFCIFFVFCLGVLHSETREQSKLLLFDESLRVFLTRFIFTSPRRKKCSTCRNDIRRNGILPFTLYI